MRAYLYTQICLELSKAQASEASSSGAIASAIAMLNGIFGFSQYYLHKQGVLDKVVHAKAVVDSMAIQNYANQLNAINTFDSTSWLHDIKVPCLVLASDDDLLASAEQGKYIAGAISGSEYYCFQNAGHALREEQPELFNKLVLDFIAKHR
jgi:pimeloyl-ACP methyl ester carboxylesterase